MDRSQFIESFIHFLVAHGVDLVAGSSLAGQHLGGFLLDFEIPLGAALLDQAPVPSPILEHTGKEIGEELGQKSNKEFHGVAVRLGSGLGEP